MKKPGKKLICALTLLFTAAVVSCAGPHRKTQENDNRQRFVELLSDRKIRQAYKFYLALGDEVNTLAQEQPEVLAQYHLSNCQPRMAMEHINKIKVAEVRNLFRATLYALVSVERPRKRKTKSPLSEGLRYPIQTEVWSDEWKDLEMEVCQEMPQLSNEGLREKYREESLKGFEASSEHFILRDPEVIALALEVGYKFQDAEPAKRELSSVGHPYAHRMEYLPIEEKKLQVMGHKDKGYILSELSLESVETRVQPINIPVLLK